MNVSLLNNRRLLRPGELSPEKPVEFDLVDLSRLRPRLRSSVVFIVSSLSLELQKLARREAQAALQRWGSNDAEITVYLGWRYRLPAKLVLDVVNDYRKKHGWKDMGIAPKDVWQLASYVNKRVNS